MAKVNGHEGLMIVAHGNMFSRSPNSKLENVELPKDMTKVKVVKVIKQFIDLKVDYPRARQRHTRFMQSGLHQVTKGVD
jgi:hypothetical protein